MHRPLSRLHWLATLTTVVGSLFLVSSPANAATADSEVIMTPRVITQPKMVWADLNIATPAIVAPGFAIDSSPPQSLVTIDEGSKFTKSKEIRVDASCRDKETGCNLMRVTTDGKKPGDWMPFQSKHTIKVVRDGARQVTTEVTDGAGNVSRASESILVDTTAPKVALAGPWGTDTRNKPTIRALVRDWGAGLDRKRVKISVDGKSINAIPSKTGWVDYRFKRPLARGKHRVDMNVYDKVGNAGKVSWYFRSRPIVKAPGKNHSSRGGRKPKVVVMHSTAGSYPGDYNTLRRRGTGVSVHIYIRKNGDVYKIIPDYRSAWHAGKSRLGKIKGPGNSLNAVSLGIELENRNTGRDPYTPDQIESAAEVTKRWMKLYDIPKSRVVSHQRIAPARKSDPKGFPWSVFWTEVERS